MVGERDTKAERLTERLSPKKNADRDWYFSLLDEDAQRAYEEGRLAAVLVALKLFHLKRYQRRIAEIEAEIEALRSGDSYGAEEYRLILLKQAEIKAQQRRLDAFKCYFQEPYFARMDVVDAEEGYNSYYIGKKGDVRLEIVDWRAPMAVRYYQKSRVDFKINEYEYHTVLRRALSVKNGKLLDFKNEYLSVKDVLTPEEIAGRDEEILFDPYLRSIIKSRKDDVHVRDIIETIQERQFDVITRPERESFVVQGCAGSGKTMILLHRLSYLMYNNEALKARDVLVITPSDSFNSFIDELAQVLELEKVTTITLKNYFFRVLAGEGIDLASRLSGERESEAYLAYLFSDRFPADVKRKIERIYADMVGLFTAEECRSVANELLDECAERREKYTLIKNASTRIRRAVLGEMKENKEGGFYFTKPFRALMGDYAQIEDFLTYVLREPARTPDYFFRLFREFYRCAAHAQANAAQVFNEAQSSLAALRGTVEREIEDLKRYRLKRGGAEIYTYAERIARREELIGEIGRTAKTVEEIGQGTQLLSEFFSAVRRAGYCMELGKCRDNVDIARWLYRETVKKYKNKFRLKGIYPSDGYALCAVLAAAGRQLTPRYGLVFVDEGQDLSAGEYALLTRINPEAVFNVFGDLKQNITPWRGVKNWDAPGLPVYTLERNYRNTTEIVDYVSRELGVEMLSIGLHGEEVTRVKLRKLGTYFRGRHGLKAVIAREEDLYRFEKRGFKRLPADGKLSKTCVNVLTVYESKGLEFTAVAVYDRGMSENERYIAYTRALADLVIAED